MNPVTWKRWTGGELHLNMGDRSSVRGVAQDTIDEIYTIEHVGGDAASESVRVRFGGYEKTYHKVTKIVAHAGDGKDRITIGSGVLVPVALHGGGGDDILTHRGSGHAVINGDDGSDYLEAKDNAGTAEYHGGAGSDEIVHNGGGAATIYGDGGDDRRLYGGSGADVIHGGDGNDTIDGRGGADTIDGGAGDDRIQWQAAQLALNSVQGGAGTDELVVSVTASDDELVISTLAARAVKFARMSAGAEWGSIETAGIENLTVHTLAGTDEVTVRGTGGDDRVTLVGRNENGGSAQDVGIVITDGGGAAVVDILLTGCRRADGDVLIVDALGGNDTIEVKDPNPQGNLAYPDLVALQLAGGAGNDRIIGSPFDDIIDGGPGSDTLTGGQGYDSFFDASTATSGDIDTIKERVDADAGLFDNLLVVGYLLQNDGQAPFAAGVVVEHLNGLFERAELTGGAGSNTFVVNDADHQIQVSSAALSVSTWTGVAVLDSGPNGSGAVEHYFIALIPGNAARIDIADTGSGSGRLAVTGNGQPDWVTLDVSNIGGIQKGTLAASGRSFTRVDFTGVERVEVDTGSGDDQIAVRAIGTKTNIYAGDGDDLILVGSQALVGATASNQTGNIKTNGHLLTIDGEGATGSDRLDMDDTGKSSGSRQLTAGSLRDLINGDDIAYSGIESLNLGVGVYPLSVDVAGSDLRKLSVTASGTLTVPQVAMDSGEIRLTAVGDIDVTDITVTSGVVALSSNLNIQHGTNNPGRIAANHLTVTAGGAVDLATDVDELVATAGDTITFSEADGIHIIQLESINGSINLSAGGDITADDIASQSQNVTLSASADIIITGTVVAANTKKIELTGDNIRISPLGLVEAIDGAVVMDAADEIFIDMVLAAGAGITGTSGAVTQAGTEYTVFDIDVDQIGWFDPGTQTEYDAGMPGNPYLVPAAADPDDFGVSYRRSVAPQEFASLGSNATLIWDVLVTSGYISADGIILNKYSGLTPGFRNDLSTTNYYPVGEAAVYGDPVEEAARVLDSKFPLKKLYRVTYRPGSGRVIIERDEPQSGDPNEYAYVPAWSSSDQWEYLTAAEFLGDSYDQLPPNERPDFYVKIKAGAMAEIRRPGFVDEEAVTQEDVGDTWLTTKIALHQIGWWWKGWESGASPDAYVKDVIKAGFTWNDSWTTAGKDSDTLLLSDFMDLREQLLNPDDERAQNFQTGVKQPADEGAGWVPWYVYEYVNADSRQVTLGDGRDYDFTDKADAVNIPDWVPAGAILETRELMGRYVLVPVTPEFDGPHRNIDNSNSGWTGDLHAYNWSPGLHDFEANPDKDCDGDGDTATKQISADHSMDIEEKSVVVLTAEEYLGYYRDYRYSYWTGWYGNDTGTMYKKGSWYGNSRCADIQTAWEIWPFTKKSRYNFAVYTGNYHHYGSSRDFYSDQVSWTPTSVAPDTDPQHWEQVAVDFHWQYRGWLADQGYLDTHSGANNDKWIPNLVWTNGTQYSGTRPADVPHQNDGNRPNSDYFRVDEFEDRRHFAYDLTHASDVLDPRRHLNYRFQSANRPYFESFPVKTASLTAVAGTRIRLNTQVDQIEKAEVTGTGDLRIKEKDALILKNVTTADGSVTVDATTNDADGTIHAQQVKAGGDALGNGVTLRTKTGDIVVGHIEAGSTNGFIQLRTANGSIKDGDNPDTAEVDLSARVCFYTMKPAISNLSDLETDPGMTIIGIIDDPFTTDKNTSLNIFPDQLLANDTVLPAGSIIVAGIDTGASIGLVTGNPVDGFEYDPDGKFELLKSGDAAPDAFTYQVTYNTGAGDITVDGATVVVTVTGIDDPLEMTGRIYDGPIAGAVVRALLNGAPVSGEATSDQSGAFTLHIYPDSLAPDARLVIEAVKPGTGIRLVSVLPTVAELEMLAGIANTISDSQLSELIVSNISSAALALIDSNLDGAVDPAELTAIEEFVAAYPVEVTQAIRGIATAIKVVIDEPLVDLQTVVQLVKNNIDGMQGLPTDTQDVLELVTAALGAIQPYEFEKVLTLVDQMLALFQQAFPGPIEAARLAMRNDAVLADQYRAWVNGPPIAYISSAMTLEEQAVSVDSPAADPDDNGYLAADPDDDFLTMVPLSDPTHGVLANDNGWIYTPAPDFFGEDQFLFVVTDGIWTSNPAPFVITVIPVNDEPTLNLPMGDQSVDEGGTLVFTALASDPDLPFDTLEFSLGDDALPGASIDPVSGVFTWVLAGIQGPGAYPLTVRVTDGGDPELTDEQTITVTVHNTAPVANEDAAVADEDTQAVFNPLINDIDAGGDVLTISGLDTLDTIGKVTLNPDGTLTYDPNGQFEGLGTGDTATDRFIYSIADGDGGVDSAAVVVTITGVNDAPAGGDDAYEMDENDSLAVSPSDGLLVNDADIDLDPLTAVIVSAPANGNLVLEDDGSFVYNPVSEFFGVDTFTYSASDGMAVSDPVTVTVTVHRTIELAGIVSDGPVAGALVTVKADGKEYGHVMTGPDGRFTLKIRPDELSANVRPVIEALKPDEGIKLMSLLPKVSEIDLLAGPADVLSYLQHSDLTLSNITSALFAVMDKHEDDRVSEFEKRSFDFLLALSPISVKKVIRGMAAAIKVVVDNPFVSMETVNALVTGLPQEFVSFDDVMALVRSKAVLALFDAVFDQEIQGAVDAMRNDPILKDQFAMWANSLPSADDIAVFTPEDHSLTLELPAEDPDGDSLDVTLVNAPQHGELIFDDEGLFTYTPELHFNGLDSFTYFVSDGIGDSEEATVDITIERVNDEPQINPIDGQVVREGSELTFNAIADDPDQADDPNLPIESLTFSLVGDYPDGAEIDPVTGQFSWTPTEEQGPWTYTLTVAVTDAGIAGPVLSNTTIVTITVLEDEHMDTGPLADNAVADEYRVRVNDTTVEALLNGTVVFSAPLAGALPLTINGSGDNDTLVVELGDGNPIPAGGLRFNGGGPGDFDTLVITGGTAATVTHSFSSADSGTVDLDGSIISYTGLEPIRDDIDATHRVFRFGDGPDAIWVGDDATPNDNYSRIASAGSGETVDFRNPTASLTINTGGGNAAINIAKFDAVPGGGAVRFDVIVNGQGGDLQIDSLNAGPERTVTLTAGGDISGPGQITASDLTLTAAGDVELNTTVNALTATTPGDLAVSEIDAITMATEVASLTLKIEESGDAAVTEADNLILDFANLFNGTLTVNADNIAIIGTVTANEIVLTSGGAISAGLPGQVVSGSLSATAAAGMVLNTRVDEITAHVTDIGNILITEADAVVLNHLSTEDGWINVTAVGDITATLIHCINDADDNDITLTATSGNIEAGVVTAGEAGDVILTAGGAIVDIAGKITADELAATATGAMVLNTTVTVLTAATDGALTVTESEGIMLQSDIASLTLTTGAAGDVEIDELNDLILASVNVFNGTLTVDADSITVSGAVSANAITLRSKGSMSMTSPAILAAGKLEAYSVKGLALNTRAEEITAHVTGPGNIQIEEADAVVLSHLSAHDGWINVTAGGDITATLVHCVIDAEVNDISLTTTGSHIQATEINAGLLGDVFLTSTGPLTAKVTAHEMAATAAGDMTLHTTVAFLQAETTAAGDIVITETDDIVLQSILAFDGSITVVAGGTISALNLESLTDAAGSDIRLTAASGDVLIDFIAVGIAYGGITVQAAGNIHEYNVAPDPDDEIDLRGHHAYMDAGGEFGSTIDPELNLEMDLTIIGFYGEDFIFDFVGDIELNVFASGIVRVDATGTITARNVESGAGDIELNAAGGDIVIGYLDAGTEAGIVGLTAAGSILEMHPDDAQGDLVAKIAHLAAGTSIWGGSVDNLYLEIQLAALTAEVGSSKIFLNEADDIELVSVVAPDGEIGIMAGGDVLITGLVTTGTAAGTTSLQAGGRIYLEGDDPVTTDLLEAVANSGIFLRTRVSTLDARVEDQGNLEIRETDSIVLREITNANGPIHVKAGGEIAAIRVESLAHQKGNNIGLMTLDGDILVDYIGVGNENGQISLSSAGDIGETAVADAAVDLSGALGIFCAQGKIDRDLDRSFKPIGHHGKKKHHCKKGHHRQKETLYEFERGEKLKLKHVPGDVELFFSLENKVEVSTTGDIRVVYLDSNGHDIELESKYGGIQVETLDSGPVKGDIELDADNRVYLAGQLYSGATGQIIAGDDLEICAGGEIRILGIISAGDDIRMDSNDADVVIEGMVNAGDDIEIDAAGDILISAAVEAGEDLDLYANGSITTTHSSATLTAGVDVELETRYGAIELRGAIQSGNGRTYSPDVLIDAGAELFLYAAIDSLDDVEIWADDGVFIDASVTAIDDIKIGTCGELTTTAFAPLSAGDDIELYAKKEIIIDAAMAAGGDVNIDSRDSDVLINGVVTTGGWIDVVADGDLEISAAVTAGEDIGIKSRDSDVLVAGTLTAGDEIDVYADGDLAISVAMDAGGDLDLYARHDLITVNPAATLTAGVDVELETRYGTIELWGAVQSGDGQTYSPDVLIDSGSELYIYASINSLDDVEIWADDGILIDAAITAADKMEIATCGSLEITVNASLSSNDDLELYAREIFTIEGAVSSAGDIDIYSRADLRITGTIRAQDDVTVYSRDNIDVSGRIEAFDRIRLTARDDLNLHSLASLTGLDGGKARFVYLSAGKEMTLDGFINAERLVVC